jgi:hypothetical protein
MITPGTPFSSAIAAERGDLDLAHTVPGMLVARALRGQL